MKVILLLLLSIVVCPLAFAARVDIPGYGEHCNDCVMTIDGSTLHPVH